ncbi:MAG TPA: hypothetical protein VH414_18350 [Lichenihabitans sp.]|jgi:hypothetical protein|nr:hypothetical protein [Lichenihabitans sp.]
MPRYFLHLEVYGRLVEDPEGEEFSGVAAARGAALKAAREIMSNRVFQGKPANGGRFLITDDARNVVSEVFFEEAISGR